MKKSNYLKYEELMYLYKTNLTDFHYVIIDGRIKEWIGKQFIDIREATEKDKEIYPNII